MDYFYQYMSQKKVQVQKTSSNNVFQQQESKEEELSSVSDSSSSQFFSFLDDLPTTKKPETPIKKTPGEKAKPKKAEGVTGAKRKAVTAGPSTSKKKKKAYEGSEIGHGGEIMFELSMMKYLTANKKDGKLTVGIREYYHDDGKLLPSKEGISLTLDQYQRLKSQLASVDKVLKDLS